MSSSDWWSKKMGDPVPTRQSGTPPMRPPSIPNVRYVPEGEFSATPVAYDPDQDTLVTKANSAKSQNSDRCPECNSANYMRMGSGVSTMSGVVHVWRCYDCGYPKTQSGTGSGLPSDSSGPSTPARQVHTGNNFNPNVIVDRMA